MTARTGSALSRNCSGRPKRVWRVGQSRGSPTRLSYAFSFCRWHKFHHLVRKMGAECPSLEQANWSFLAVLQFYSSYRTVVVTLAYEFLHVYIGADILDGEGKDAPVANNHDIPALFAACCFKQAIPHTFEQLQVVFAIGKRELVLAGKPGEDNSIVQFPVLSGWWLKFQLANVHLAKLLHHGHRQAQFPRDNVCRLMRSFQRRGVDLVNLLIFEENSCLLRL